MAISMNTSVEYSSKATFLQGFTTYGDVMVGDKAFEFYNEKNKEDWSGEVMNLLKDLPADSEVYNVDFHI